MIKRPAQAGSTASVRWSPLTSSALPAPLLLACPSCIPARLPAPPGIPDSPVPYFPSPLPAHSSTTGRGTPGVAVSGPHTAPHSPHGSTPRTTGRSVECRHGGHPAADGRCPHDRHDTVWHPATPATPATPPTTPTPPEPLLTSRFSRTRSRVLHLLPFPSGPMAQWKSVPFTPERSLVRSQLGPQNTTPVRRSDPILAFAHRGFVHPSPNPSGAPGSHPVDTALGITADGTGTVPHRAVSVVHDNRPPDNRPSPISTGTPQSAPAG